MPEQACFQIPSAAIGIDNLSRGRFRHGVDREVAALEVLLQCDVWSKLGGEPLVAQANFALESRESVFLVRAWMQKYREFAPYWHESVTLQLIGAGADNDPIALVYRTSEQTIPNRAANQVDFHTSILPGVLMRRAQDRVFCVADWSCGLVTGSRGPAHGSSDRAASEEIHSRGGLLLRLLLITGLVATLSGCYVMQAATGEMHVLEARKPIDKVIVDPATPEPLKETLNEVRAAREFASRELELPDNKSYRTYSNINRPFVVWNVVATPEFSVHPKLWCFPIVGCVSYRGYFSEKHAREFAEGLKKRGFDVTLDGVPAYSTLGKFADPVLSTMLPYGPDELAATIFHELAHQLLYVKNDTQFNEAFATTVENAGLERWLKFNGRADAFQRYRKDSTRERQFVELFAHTRSQLAKLYASGVAPEEMRQKKAQAFADLASEVRDLEMRLGLHRTLYDHWIKEGLNNARLASEANYYDCVPGFERLLADQGNDLPRFYAAAREMSKLPMAERHAKLCRTPAAPSETTAGGESQ